ncbi:tyrosine-type recombinase/integrase [Denitromonas halophila]|uniref:Tyrosine-type recombinase/integrase n=1 Tax=Denitromonas halophila TaxID=1629404 RepID=A0A557QJJ3_9RHOO|nr:site-specific integrase [Denitromonas halophila]TVO53078.1 tyrosine-type recombinase/integrase [Denitromonas halophila]
MAKLNDRLIRAAKHEDDDKFLSDGSGLYLRVRKSGGKYWLYRYKVGTRTRWFDLGMYPSLSLADARAEATRLTADRKQGIDPVAERERETMEREAAANAQAEALEAQNARITVSGLFKRWAEVDLIRRKDGGAEVRRMFEKDVLPTLGALPVEDVRKGHVTGVTDALLARGVPRMAKVIFSLMRQMFRFAVDRDIIEFEPTSAIRKAKIGGKDTERDRVLSEGEIKALARQLPTSAASASTQCAVWLALSTCCRIGELLGARWEHVDLNTGTWRIPAENSKNSKEHTVFLSAFALTQFEQLKATANAKLAEARKKSPDAQPCPWIYPNRQGDAPVCPKTVTKQLGDRQREGKAPMSRRVKVERASSLTLSGGRWTPHDLRRTGATMMVALGVIPEVAERCLNHTEENRVKRTYQRHSYENEMHEGWRLLGERLELLTRSGADNVVTLRGAA